MRDALGDRIKEEYENRTKTFLPRRTYGIVRLDMRAGHTYCKNLNRPYDLKFMSLMDNTAKYLCEEISGAKLAFVQSDEISIVFTDFDGIDTQAWFNGSVQKITSISASMAAAKFNQLAALNRCYKVDLEDNYLVIDDETILNLPLATFDARVFSVSEASAVFDVFLWRQQDATKNSIQMLAQSHFSHKELQGKDCRDIQDMLVLQRKINWNNCPVGFKRGRAVVKRKSEKPVSFVHKKTNELITLPNVERNEWVIEEPPIFTQNPEYIYDLLPVTK